VAEGVVEAIHLAARRSELPTRVERARAVAGRGIEGDRNWFPDGDAGSGEAITLIEAEALEALVRDTGIVLSAAASRRQVLTRGISLNDLVGRRFHVGDVLCEGVELCEPCRHLARLTEPGVLEGLVHRAGLRADILTGGVIARGDRVRAEQPAPPTPPEQPGPDRGDAPSSAPTPPEQPPQPRPEEGGEAPPTPPGGAPGSNRQGAAT
jgi:MOSC domain-containing protein YiiM